MLFKALIGIVLFVAGNCRPGPNDIAWNDHQSNDQLVDEQTWNQEVTSNKLPTYGLTEDSIGEDTVDKEGKEFMNRTAEYRKNPCAFERCSDGAMCVVKDLEKSITECVCPKTCPKGNDKTKVCSAMGVQFESKCHLHMHACRKGRNIEVAYDGSCVSNSQSCSQEMLEEFPSRFLDWALMVKEEEVNGEANMKMNLVDLPVQHQVHVAKWLFEKHDSNKNFYLDVDETLQLKMYLLPVELCVERFLSDCDSSLDGRIEVDEWKRCLLPGSNTVDDEYFNDVH